jgi:hypothetical protein
MSAYAVSLVVLAAVGATGLFSLWLAWHGAAPIGRVSNQIPFVISGGLGGLALLSIGTCVFVLQNRRYIEARERAQFNDIIDAAGVALETARRARGVSSS